MQGHGSCIGTHRSGSGQCISCREHGFYVEGADPGDLNPVWGVCIHQERHGTGVVD